MFLKPQKRKTIIPLNVIPLIDICSIIIIFFVMDSFFGTSSIVVPEPLTLPRSVSEENVDNATTLIVLKDSVQFEPFGQNYSLSIFKNLNHPELIKIREKIRKFVAAIPPENRGSGVLLNFVADRSSPYEDIFNVIKIFREEGFESILFVAEGDKK